MIRSIFLTLLLSVLPEAEGLSLFPYKNNQEYKDCRAAKEFIASAEFLKKEKVFPLHSKEARDLAYKIATGCRGSAQRFKDVFRTLDKAGFPRHKIIQVALDYTNRSDAQTKAFCLSFQKAFLKKYLDMTAIDAFELAQSLAGDIDENYSVAAKDFEEMVAFCVNHKLVSLPKKYCAEQSLKLAQSSSRYKDFLFSDFKTLYFWFQKNLGEEIPAQKAIDWALNVVSGGPKAKENFIRSFNYLKNSSDFPLLLEDRIQFALKVSRVSHQFSEDHPYNSEEL